MDDAIEKRRLLVKRQRPRACKALKRFRHVGRNAHPDRVVVAEVHKRRAYHACASTVRPGRPESVKMLNFTNESRIWILVVVGGRFSS
jgi:hypothetical protein